MFWTGFGMGAFVIAASMIFVMALYRMIKDKKIMTRR